MFYGGKLLSHLSGDENAIEDFIKLQKLNQNMAIIIDSDRKKSAEHINKTKKRIQGEFENNNQFVWVTAGKEIENYLPEYLYKSALNDIHANAETIPTYGRYQDLTEYWIKPNKSDTTQRNIDKLKVSHYIEKKDADFSILDLKIKIKELSEFIKSANFLKV